MTLRNHQTLTLVLHKTAPENGDSDIGVLYLYLLMLEYDE